MYLLLQCILLILGFAMLVKGADWFVEGSAGIADRFGIPQLVIGLTIVAMGTSAPEAAVSITAALKGSAAITIGNVVGSNILNVLIILGITACIIPVAVSRSTVRAELPYMILITGLLLGLGLHRQKKSSCGRASSSGWPFSSIWATSLSWRKKTGRNQPRHTVTHRCGSCYSSPPPA